MLVDHERRSATRANHSATHLLHEALRQVLGPHVAQKGSLVAPDRLRFDFSHPKPMSAEEVAAVESMANAFVLQNSPVETRLMALEDAMETGAMALFGEKYGDEVRVVSMGDRRAVLPEADKQGQQGVVGGAVRRHARGAHRRHRPHQGDRRERQRAGVRRIEALTADGARGLLWRIRMRACASWRQLLRTKPDERGRRASRHCIEERKQLERQLAEAKRQLALGGTVRPRRQRRGRRPRRPCAPSATSS